MNELETHIADKHKPKKATPKFGFFTVIVLLWLASLASSCSREILITNQNETATGPVIQCILQPDSSHTLLYSRVVGISENFSPQNNALISLRINSKITYPFFVKSPGVFQTDPSTISPRDSFYLNFSSPLDTFELFGAMPSAIEFTKTDTFTQPIAGIGLTQNFLIQFRDSAIDENFYRITAHQSIKRYLFNRSNQIIDSSITWEPLKIDGGEIPFLRNNYNNYTDHEILFSDDIFNGALTTFEFYNLLPFSNSKSEKTLAVKVTLENLTKDLYDFYNSRAAHLWNQKSITQLPGPVEGNIPNGYGVIGGATKAEWTVKYP